MKTMKDLTKKKEEAWVMGDNGKSHYSDPEGFGQGTSRGIAIGPSSIGKYMGNGGDITLNLLNKETRGSKVTSEATDHLQMLLQAQEELDDRKVNTISANISLYPEEDMKREIKKIRLLQNILNVACIVLFGMACLMVYTLIN